MDGRGRRGRVGAATGRRGVGIGPSVARGSMLATWKRHSDRACGPARCHRLFLPVPPSRPCGETAVASARAAARCTTRAWARRGAPRPTPSSGGPQGGRQPPLRGRRTRPWVEALGFNAGRASFFLWPAAPPAGGAGTPAKAATPRSQTTAEGRTDTRAPSENRQSNALPTINRRQRASPPPCTRPSRSETDHHCSRSPLTPPPAPPPPPPPRSGALSTSGCTS